MAFTSYVRTRPAESPPAVPPPPSHQNPEQTAKQDVMSSLETVQPSLEEYLRSFGFDPANLQEQGYYEGYSQGENRGGNGTGETWMHVPSSDAFLQGVLTGHWSDLPPSRTPGLQQQNPLYQADLGAPPRLSERPIDLRGEEYIQYGEAQQSNTHGTYMSSPAPPSDGGLSSTASSILPAGGTNTQYPPPLSHQPSPPTVSTGADHLQASFLWDNFLKELGVQGDST